MSAPGISTNASGGLFFRGEEEQGFDDDARDNDALNPWPQHDAEPQYIIASAPVHVGEYLLPPVVQEMRMRAGVPSSTTPFDLTSWGRFAQARVGVHAPQIAGLWYECEFSATSMAEKRLSELEESMAEPTLFGGIGGDDPDDDPQSPLSPAAVSRTRQLLRQLTMPIMFLGSRSLGRISIFPMPNGGIQLQRTGELSSISLEVPPNNADPILAEFATDSEYRSKEFLDLGGAAEFLAQPIR